MLAAEETPDLIILDWMIEGTSGIEVCRRLRRDKETAHVPIIMLTAREADIVRLLAEGMSNAEIAAEIAGPSGMLDLEVDPKLAWALAKRAAFPVDVNKADRDLLPRLRRPLAPAHRQHRHRARGQPDRAAPAAAPAGTT